MFTEKEIKAAVRKRYGDHAGKRLSLGRKGHILDMEGRVSAEDVGYSAEDLAAAPENADLGLSCGNPLGMLGPSPGQTVLDLGCGGGLDCFIAAKNVGPHGRVIGVDMTQEMVDLARRNAADRGYTNVEFKLAEIENLPVDDRSVDLVVSNCVINLVANKAKAFSEAFRTLRPGGRIAVSDIVTLPDVPKRLSRSLKAYTACLSGAIPKQEYLDLIEQTGFCAIQVVGERTWPFFRGYMSLSVVAWRSSNA